jgi:hypothetical protein
MPSVYHYTDTNGLFGILSSRALFASDHRYLNDSSEGTVIEDLIIPILESEIAEITPKLIAKRWLKPEFYDRHGISGHLLQARLQYKAFVRATQNVSPFFVLSFCRHDECSETSRHGLLSQWRGYAGSGGFAIEFDEKLLDGLLVAEHAAFAYAMTKSDEVLYEKFDRLFDPQVYSGVAGEMIWSIFDHVKIDASELTGRKDLDQTVLSFATTAPFLKHWGFREEREYRIVTACIRPTKIPEGERRPAKQIKFRQRNSLVVPYIELFGTLPDPLPIKAIIIGPHPAQEKQEQALNMLLESHKLDVNVRLSSIPYS